MARDQSYTVIDAQTLLNASQRFLDEALADKEIEIEALITAKIGTRDWCFGKTYDRVTATKVLSAEYDAPISTVRAMYRMKIERVSTLRALAKVAGNRSVTLLASDCELLLPYLT